MQNSIIFATHSSPLIFTVKDQNERGMGQNQFVRGVIVVVVVCVYGIQHDGI